LAEEE
jgi:uncharacterized Tic20 family protein